jgi:sigma-B regulation protein RsbU (phosphoserine phosphatase)
MKARSQGEIEEIVFRCLSENSIFAALGDEILRDLAKNTRIEEFDGGDVLIRQGDVGDFAYLIVEGSASVELETETGTAQIAIIESGAMLGEIAVFAETNRSATVRAREEVTAARLERAVIRDFVELNADVALGIIAELGNRLQEINKPMASLTQAAEALRHGRFRPELLDTLDSAANEFKHFAEVFEGMAKEITEKMNLRREMQMAQDIQRAFLPAPDAPIPHQDRYEIAAEMIAAKDVGGDFYDYFALDDDQLAIVVGDVSGKGVPAALFMAAARTIIKTTSQLGLTPCECVARVNQTIAEDNEEMMFVTLFYGVVDLKTGLFRYCNAGHNPCFVIRKDGALERMMPSGGAVGLSEKMDYVQDEITLGTGDTLFFYTDGVTESVNRDGEQFGDNRLVELLTDHGGLTADPLVKKIHTAVDVYASGLDRFDDTTCLAFRRHSSS